MFLKSFHFSLDDFGFFRSIIAFDNRLFNGLFPFVQRLSQLGDVVLKRCEAPEFVMLLSKLDQLLGRFFPFLLELPFKFAESHGMLGT